MVSQGFPQLVRVSADILRPDPTKTFPERTPIISQVRMINEAPWIPDLERIEEMISEETSVLVESRNGGQLSVLRRFVVPVEAVHQPMQQRREQQRAVTMNTSPVEREQSREQFAGWR